MARKIIINNRETFKLELVLECTLCDPKEVDIDWKGIEKDIDECLKSTVFFANGISARALSFKWRKTRDKKN